MRRLPSDFLKDEAPILHALASAYHCLPHELLELTPEQLEFDTAVYLWCRGEEALVEAYEAMQRKLQKR